MKAKQFNSNPRKKNLGQGIVEFALVMPVLLLLILGVFEMGRLMWIFASVTSASREAARYGSGIGQSGSGVPQYIDCDGILNRALAFGAPGEVTSGDVTIVYDEGPGTTQIGACPVAADSIEMGDRISVSVVGHYQPLTALPLIDFPDFDINSLTRRTIIKEVLID